MNDYIIYQSKYISEHQQDIIRDIDIAHRLFKQMFPEKNSTWTYDKYNIFALTACSSNFYKIYQELRDLIRQTLGHDNQLWIQSWVNYLKFDELSELDWHSHNFLYHGYICIDPKNTDTVFEGYKIKNTVGQIYLGPGYRKHKVDSADRYEGERITLGFDVVDLKETEYVKYQERPWGNLSLYPLL